MAQRNSARRAPVIEHIPGSLEYVPSIRQATVAECGAQQNAIAGPAVPA
jgi:hypothetical protein